MSTLGNIIWLICGGVIAGLSWFVAGIVMIVTIVGIPWARACFVIAKFNFSPFGRELISRKELTGRDDIGTGFLGLIGNVIWFLLFGWSLALIHLIGAALCATTIIGIPFAWQHVKLAAVSFAPIGKTVVKKHLAEAARMRDAQAELNQIRGEQPQMALPQNPAPIVSQAALPVSAALQLPPTPTMRVARGESVVGEFTEAEVRQYIAVGELVDSDWFWNEDKGEWEPLSTIQ